MTASGAHTHILARSLTPCEVRNNQGGRPSRHGEGCRPPTNKSNKSGLQGRFRFTLTFRKYYGQNRLSTPTLPVFPGILLAEGHSGLLRTRLDGNTVSRQPGKQERYYMADIKGEKLNGWYKTVNRCTIREVESATNASAESLNSKMKAFRAQLRGVSDLPFFMYRLSTIFG